MELLRRIFISAIIMTSVMCLSPADAMAADNTVIGYGQGHETDDCNCPVGALMFNQDYSKYGAYAVTDDKTICLTFDQGYENGCTADILDTLKEKNVKAIFFLTGDYAKRNDQLVRRMIDEGHIIGNHGMKHASLPKLTEEDAREEIMSLHRYISEKYGYEMEYFRPPCGEFSENALSIASKCGYKTLVWSFAYCDWNTDDQPEPNAALERITGAAHNGAIYLLHSVSETNRQILPSVIDKLRADGYEFGLPSDFPDN